MGLMVFSGALGSLSSDFAKDTVALAHLKGKAAMAVEYSMVIGLSILAVVIGMSGGMMAANEEASEASEEATGKLSKLVQKINAKLENNLLARGAQWLNNKVSSALPEVVSQLVEKYTATVLIRLTQITAAIQMANGSLSIAQSAGNILTALVTEMIQDIQADLTELTAQNGQVQDNIQHIEDDLSKTIKGLESELSASQMIPLGLASFTI